MRAPFGSYSMAYAAEHVQVGRNTLFKTLRERGVFDGRNRAKDEYVRQGFFVVETGQWVDQKAGQQYYPRTFVTRRGLVWLKQFMEVRR